MFFFQQEFYNFFTSKNEAYFNCQNHVKSVQFGGNYEVFAKKKRGKL